MRIINYVTAFSIVLLFLGCGKIEDQTQDDNTVVEETVNAYNCSNSGTPQNEYGCYDSDVTFKGETMTKGVWSVYTQSNINRTDNTVFYDRYQYGFVFSAQGSAGKQEKTDGYILYREWGVDGEGVSFTLSEEGTYSYSDSFVGQDCFKVTNTNEANTLKLCHESFVNQDFENATGYYGTDVTFGNLNNYDFTVVGTWTVAGYDSNSAGSASVTLDANGTTSNGGEWGVSEDGKVIGIDGVRYLAYQYLEPKSAQCIAVFELSGGLASSVKWKLCKQ